MADAEAPPADAPAEGEVPLEVSLKGSSCLTLHGDMFYQEEDPLPPACMDLTDFPLKVTLPLLVLRP